MSLLVAIEADHWASGLLWSLPSWCFGWLVGDRRILCAGNEASCIGRRRASGNAVRAGSGLQRSCPGGLLLFWLGRLVGLLEHGRILDAIDRGWGSGGKRFSGDTVRGGRELRRSWTLSFLLGCLGQFAGCLDRRWSLAAVNRGSARHPNCSVDIACAGLGLYGSWTRTLLPWCFPGPVGLPDCSFRCILRTIDRIRVSSRNAVRNGGGLLGSVNGL
jgi:hypothetical protein